MKIRVGVLAVATVALMVFAGLAAASPPVPPPVEGYNIVTNVDVEMSSGDFTEVETFTSSWVANMGTEPWLGPGSDPEPDDDGVDDTTLPFPGNPQFLDDFGRVAQIRYTEEMQSTDTSFFQFKKGFAADSHGGADTAGNNLSVEKNYGYVASEASLIANAENKERVGLSIVAAGDTAGLDDMPSLCPWASGYGIPATNEFIAMGSDTSTTSVMVSDTETKAAGTRAPELNHSISAVGIGMAQGLMRVQLQEGGQRYNPGGTVPDLVSSTVYSERTTAVGTIDKFFKGMHYHSTIPSYQMPEPWYQLQ